jgi:DNA polymerase I-like protein with 3'-5' exonuclease and polymerase domains
MDLLVVDFETYYAKDYGLRKCTTEEYIRHPLFEVIGVAVKVVGKNYHQNIASVPVWFSGSKKQVANFLSQFDWENSVALAHNAMFDMAILSWHFGIKPKKIADTLAMARAIHSIEVGGSLAALSEYYGLGVKGTEVHDAIGKKRLDFTKKDLKAYGGYCIQDVELTHKLFKVLVKHLPVFELNLIDLTIRMFSEPTLVLDKDILVAHLKQVKDTKEALMAKVTHDKKKLTSNPQFAELLRTFGIEPPLKISPTTGKETYAFAKSDEAFKALQEHENPEVQAIVAARLGVRSTIEETRTQRFIDIAERGTLPIPLRYYAAHTGRWGGDDKINMQNLPRGSQLKKAMCAPEGYKFVDCDLSQIEARTLAWLAEEEDLVDAFDRGDDVYKIMASAIYDKPESEITKEERFVGKTTILGAGYGMGAAKFRAQLKTFGVDLPEEECERIIQVYRETYPEIPALWRAASRALKTMMDDEVEELGKEGILTVEGNTGIRLPNGLYIKYPNLRTQAAEEEGGYDETVYDTRKGRAIIPNRIYGGKVIENVCQALARIVIGEQLLRVAKKYKVVMTVHDAIGCIVPEEKVEEGMRHVEEAMKIRPTWAPDLPLNCEGGYGRSYGEC